MKRSKIILIIVVLIAVVAFLYFSFGVIRSRYFSSEEKGAETTKSETQNQPANQNGNTENTDQGAASSETGVSDEENAELKNSHLYITSKDCDDDCVKFKDNEENFKYCQEVCGDIPVAQKNSEEDCAGLAGLEKDYCWRDLAVSKKDIGICDKVSDAKLKTVCRNRVVEEILN